MNISKSARYALYAAMEMARTPDGVVTVAGVAERYRIPAGALAKVLQQLVRSGMAVGTRGIGGGYRLARPASRITVLNVLGVFERPRPEGQCLLAEGTSEPVCTRADACGVRALFDEVDELVQNTYASVTLETLVRRVRAARPAGPRRARSRDEQ